MVLVQVMTARHQDSHSCVIDGYNELVFILRIRIVLTLCDMDSGAFFFFFFLYIGLIVPWGATPHLHSTSYEVCV